MILRFILFLILSAQIEAILRVRLWKRCSVNQTAINEASHLKKVSVAYESDIKCSWHGSLLPEMQLFCVTNGVCNIWDSQSLLVSEPTFQISDDHCMILEGCDYPGSSEKLAVGSTVQSDDCNLEYLFVCSPNGLMKPAVEATQALTTCENPFITTDVGCLLISEERMTFPEARTLCLTYAADLFVAQSTDELSLLTDYIDATHGRNSAYWVGVQKVNNNWQWFNGRPVDNAEIHIFSNLPNERFARLEHNGKFLLADISCDHSFGTVCRATV